jgi:pimeloyl-ACP methyl ester carboxylesterase
MPRAKVNGAEIYYEETGSGPPMLLTPGGLKGVSGYFGPVVEGLSREHRVITYDRRFGGRSRSPVVVQSWELACQDVMGLMDALGIERAYLGGNSFGAAISMRCALAYPERVRAIFPGTVAGSIACDVLLGAQLLRSADIALNRGMKAVATSADPADRFSPFVPDGVQDDPDYRAAFEATAPEEFVQAMRDTVEALFDGPYAALGVTADMLKGIRTPALVMPGNDDIHPRGLAELVHRLIPNCRWGEVGRPTEEPEKYLRRVLEFLHEAGGDTG